MDSQFFLSPTALPAGAFFDSSKFLGFSGWLASFRSSEKNENVKTSSILHKLVGKEVSFCPTIDECADTGTVCGYVGDDTLLVDVTDDRCLVVPLSHVFSVNTPLKDFLV